MVPHDIPGPLQMPLYLRQSNQGKTNLRHCLFQTQANHATNVDDGRSDNKGNPRLDECNQRKRQAQHNTQIEAIKQLTTALQPRNQLPLKQAGNNAPPRVQTNTSPTVQIVAPPRVQFNIEENKEIQFDANKAPQMIVKSPPKALLKQALESIADRVKKGLQNTQVSSIAERVTQQRRESANPVLDHDTGKLLE